jgi:glycosyltransferase involved in cell wall biosynthesis
LSDTPTITTHGAKSALKVAWITYFPIEWLPDLPPELQGLPRLHPATWQRVLWEEFQKDETLDLHILVLRKSFPKSMRFRRGNTTFHCVKTMPATRGPTLFWFDTILVSRVLKEIEPDVVHAWGTEYGSAAIAGRLGYPALVTMQGILTWYGSVFKLNASMKLSRFAEPGSLRKAHVVTCESSFGMKYLKERYPHLRLLQVEHAPNPMFSEVVRVPQTRPVRLLCVGTFELWKGARVVMEALAGLVNDFDFELLWLGAKNPAIEQEMRARTGDALWKRVTFRHGVPPAEVAEELSRTNIFLHAALADNSPNAVKEAVVAGVPVVATHTGGIPDYVVSGKNGLLFESGNADDCRQKLKEAMEHPHFSKGLVDLEILKRMRVYLSARTMAEKFREGYDVTLRHDPRSPKADGG